jgi:FkbM family methyltransferase
MIMSNFFENLRIFLNSRKIFKNWYIYPKVYYKIISDEFPIFETNTGLKIKIRKNSTDLMALTHVWLIEEYKSENFDIKDTDVIIDVGAHIGLFSLYASQFCKNGLIYSFEPVPENYNLLIDNIKSNDLNQIKSFNRAVSNSNSNVKLYLNDDEAGHSMFSKSSKTITVDSISLQQIFDDNNIENCNFLKLDCEGTEYEILQNLPLSYFDKIEKIVIEYHMADSHPELLENLKKLLISQNYSLKTKKLFSDIGFLYASKN